MKNKFMKIFIAATLGTFFFSCLAVYAASKAFQEDPEIASKLGNQLGFQISRNSLNFSDFSDRVGSYRPTQDTWSFSKPAESIKMNFVSADIEVSTADIAQIQIVAEGGLAAEIAPRLIETDFNGDVLILAEPDGEAVQDLKIKIQIPQDYQQEIDIQSVNGDIHFLPVQLKNLKLKSVNGDIEGKNLSADLLQVESVSGNIQIEIKKMTTANLNSVSGDVQVDLMSTKDQISFNLESISGTIKNAVGDTATSPKKLTVKTVSGDIEIL